MLRGFWRRHLKLQLVGWYLAGLPTGGSCPPPPPLLPRIEHFGKWDWNRAAERGCRCLLLGIIVRPSTIVLGSGKRCDLGKVFAAIRVEKVNYLLELGRGDVRCC